MQRTRNNTELLVIVTPEVVAPIPAGQDLPGLKYAVKFLPPNSNIAMHNPDAKTAENTMAPSPTVIPVEKLIGSMKPEQPLAIQGESGTFGIGGGALSSAAPTLPSGPATTGANGP